MHTNEIGGAAAARNRTRVERASDRELVTTRTFDAPARAVFDAWTKPELFRRWWVPESADVSLLSCTMDARAGGGYRLEFAQAESSAPMAFFGRYVEVTPNARLVWTNDESPDGPLTTVTFADEDEGTRVVLSERYPSKEALDEAMAMTQGAMPEAFAQLDELLAELRART